MSFMSALFLGRYCGYPLHRREKFHQMSYDGKKCIVLYSDVGNIIVYTYHDSVVCLIVFSNDVLFWMFIGE